ncbi:MAG: cupin-like domain-containing protein, partial [Saprospiraceae bacterium]
QDKDLLINNYFNKNIPCVVTGLTENWQTENWTLEFFKDNFGDLKLNLERTNPTTNKVESKEMLMRDYIDYVISNDSQPEDNPFYNNTDFNPPKELYKDYQLPEYFSCMFNNLKEVDTMPTLSWIYLAPLNSITGLHTDIANTSAWNLVISGTKFWVFYPSDQAHLLRNGGVNPFNPDFDMFPSYKNAKPLVCVQKPGEIVVTPGGMWHAVLNMKTGVSLTENFVNKYNLETVQKYCVENNIALPELN